MKILILGALLVAAIPAGAIVTGDPHDPAQVILQRDQEKLTADVQDWKDYLVRLAPEVQTKYGPELAKIMTDGQAAATIEDFCPIQLRLEAWKQALSYELFPFLRGNLIQSNPSALLAQAQVEAFRSVAKLQTSALSTGQKKFFTDFKNRISQVSDSQSLDRLFDNAGLSRPAPLPQAVFIGGSVSAPTSAVPSKGLVIRDVPSPLEPDAADRTRYGKVIEYLRGRGASQKVIDMTIAEAVRQNVDPLLVLALVQNESGFHAGVTSPVGARGLMQIMPDTGRGLGISDADQLYNPLVNLRAGVRYLKGLWSQFADLSFAALSNINPFADSGVKKVIASYNAGPGAVAKYGGVPPYRETMAYVQNVLSTYLHLRRLFGSDQ